MLSFHFYVAGIVVLLALSMADASIMAGPTKDSTNGNTYYLLSTDTWTNSEAQAVALGGHLATIVNASENTWVLNTFTPYLPAAGDGEPNLWIGFYDPDTGDGGGAQHAADFRWSSGAKTTYTNWGSSEPNNFGDEYYTILEVVAYGDTAVSQWNDQDNAGNINFGVVEITSVPEPMSTGVLAVLSATALLRRGKKSNRFIEMKPHRRDKTPGAGRISS